MGESLRVGVLSRPPVLQPEARLIDFMVSSQDSRFWVGSLADRVVEEMPKGKATC